ncbi:MAG: flagellar protein FlaG [Pseudohongiellaceae bacterium]|nr:flagellar protein FlaG [Pseudohongiellaceae bacterium]
MSDINITRFLPKNVSLEKVNSAQAGSNDEEQHTRSYSEGGEAGEHHLEEPKAEHEEGVKDMTDEKELEVAVARLNDYVQTVQRDIIFGIDPGAAEPAVTVVDRKSRKLVRQFGGQEALELAKKVEAQEPLNLFKAQV